MFSGTLKDKLTNIFAFIAIIVGAVNAYLQSLVGDINYLQLAFAVILAVIGYVTGKDANIQPK